MFLISYLPKVIGIDKNIYFYIISFPIALIGLFIIENLFDKKIKNKQR
jgi:hypothetical protein